MVNDAPFSIFLQGAGGRKRGSMASDLENLITDRSKAKAELKEIQRKVWLTSDALLAFCINNKETAFLKLDEDALRRYEGVSRR